MSFLNRIGLGFLDPTNELDKFANAIKDGDVSEIVEKISNLFESVEDRLEDIAELFDAESASAKESLGATQREALRAVKREARGMIRRAKVEIGEAQKELGDKLLAMISKQVEADVLRYMSLYDPEIARRMEAAANGEPQA